MRNGLFRIEAVSGGYGVHLYPALDGGEPIRAQELVTYLEKNNIKFDLNKVKAALDNNADTIVPLNAGECPSIDETYILTLSPDNMLAVARFFPASTSGKRMPISEFLNDLKYRNINFGVQEAILQKHFGGSGFYCMDVPVAKGKQPRHGKDAEIVYHFNTDVHAKPLEKEDGSVDYFTLNIVNPCNAGDVLAHIIPADPGESGMTVQGNSIKPRDVRNCKLNYGRNIELSADRLSIRSKVTGHVTLVGNDVFVSDVYTVENVDNSTGNIDFDGSVQVNGNVATNFVVKATGNIVVKGVVEGATINAGGNIIISRGVNGMAKGELVAGGDIAAKFIENATVTAGGYVNTESILHSKVQAGSEIKVTGKKGFITGGHVQAETKVEVRTIGSNMGASTIIEVGANPMLKNRYLKVQKEISEIIAAIKNAQPIIQNFTEKKAKGARISEDQIKYVKQTAMLLETKKKELTEKNVELQELSEQVNLETKSSVLVTGEIYPGTTIIIGDVSMNVQSSYKYCRFEKQAGEVKMLPL